MLRPDIEEEWQGIMGLTGRYPGYSISTWSNVKDPDGQYVQPYFTRSGDYVISLSTYDGAWEVTMPVWMLMLFNFYSGRLDDVEFDYLDGDPTNCVLTNLVPVSRDEIGFRYPLAWVMDERGFRRLNRRPTRRGKKVRIVETGEVFDSVAECAEAIGGVSTGIYSVLRGTRKRHRGYTFVWM